LIIHVIVIKLFFKLLVNKHFIFKYSDFKFVIKNAFKKLKKVFNKIFNQFSDCLAPFYLVVTSTLADYNSQGEFSCANGGELFYSNGTRLITNQTTCLATARWSGQDDLQCHTG